MSVLNPSERLVNTNRGHSLKPKLKASPDRCNVKFTSERRPRKVGHSNRTGQPPVLGASMFPCLLHGDAHNKKGCPRTCFRRQADSAKSAEHLLVWRRFETGPSS
ncbi:hypothetical protein CDAR_91791 [Caerostris darwini]|uniref:Uncharacterized protein n=1 Tax=Caerostris darwini TaxID=1538125 RepID=A0AAV4QP01_9ARAC|nr:hypothetical protein CDAR_91791 [Caerostris darwini]